MKPSFRSLFIFLILICLAQKAEAHPWGGLAIDSKGNLYFTFICPLVDDDHFACVMKIDSTSQLIEILKSGSSPSDIILERSLNGNIFAAERTGFNPNFRNTLWTLKGDAFESTLTTNDQNLFHIQAYAIDDDNRIYFSKENKVYVKNDIHASPKVIAEFPDHISLVELSPSGSLYIMTGGSIYKYDGAESELVAENLKKSNPENLPFRGANIFFDMVIDENENIYLAYYGNREVLKVDTSGNITSVLSSEEPWSPHGIDLYKGDLYILESTIDDGRWWAFWRDRVGIIPRIRKLNSKGEVSTIYSYAKE